MTVMIFHMVGIMDYALKTFYLHGKCTVFCLKQRIPVGNLAKDTVP